MLAGNTIGILPKLHTPIEYIPHSYARVLWSPSLVFRSLFFYKSRTVAIWPAGVFGTIYALLGLIKHEINSSISNLLLVVAIGYVQGLCLLFLVAFGMSVVSSWLKGLGFFDQIKIVVTWSCFPFLFGALILLAMLIPVMIYWPDSMVEANLIAIYLILAALWSVYIQWSGIRVLFDGDKIAPIIVIVTPYLLFASFVFITHQLYVFIH